MALFSNSQKASCVLWLAQTNDIKVVQKKFQQEYCEFNSEATELAKCPSEEEIRSWYDTFQRTGSVDDGSSSHHLATRPIHKDPSGVDIHTTTYEKETGFMNVFGFRKIHTCHPYKMHLKHKLDKLDAVMRKSFAKQELDRIRAVHHLHHRMWFCGEARFYVNGRVECHNLFYLSENSDNPDSKLPPPANVPFVTVFAALNHDGLVGPYTHSGQVDVNGYHLFLKKFTYELKQIQRLKPRLETPIFSHDDSPLHEHAAPLLDEEFPNYWIGPKSQHAQYPRLSPDLNPLCFFLWGHIKKLVYANPIEHDEITELIHRVHHAFTEVIPDMLEAAVKAYKERLKLVVEFDGSLVDVHDDDENKPAPVDAEALALMDW